MKKNQCLVAVAFLLIAASSLAQPVRTMPQGEFVCHVVNADDSDGLAYAQADSIERAEIAIMQASVAAANKRRPAVVEVIECVPLRGAKFRSAIANDLLKTDVR